MHDLDRAMFETGEIGQPSGPAGHQEQQEFLEVLGGLLHDPGRPGETYESYESPDGRELVDRTAQETALAAELLEANESGQLDRFIGGLLSRIGGSARDLARSATGQTLAGILRRAARQALPVIGRGVGGAIGSQYAATGEQIARTAGSTFGLELEGLSQEDREFEVAKAFVRFAGAAARHAAQAPPSAPPGAVARAAVTTAAQRFAPGLLVAVSSSNGGSRRSGRWERRGDQIVIFGA